MFARIGPNYLAHVHDQEIEIGNMPPREPVALAKKKPPVHPGGSVLSVMQMECGGGCNRGCASFGLGATALNYLEVPSPIRRRLSRNGKSKRGIHNLGSGR